LAHGVVDAYPNPAPLRQITLRCDKTNALLGVEIPSGQQAKFLQSLGLEVVNPSAGTTVGEVLPGTTADPAQKITVRIPTFRVDLKRETDLIEEVARLFGVEKIPSTPPRGALGTHSYDALHDQIAEVRRLMTGLGLNETQGQTLISDSAARLIEVPWVPLQNPLSSDMNVLRPSLLPGLLAVLRHNLNHKNNDVAAFEVGRVFVNTNGSAREERRVAVAITGQRQMNFWSGDDRHARFDISDLKGIVEEFLDQFGVRGVIYTRREAPTALYVESATITLGKQVIGELGQVLPTLARQHDLRDAAFLAELNLDLLLARRAPARSFKPLPAFPSVRRDVAMLVPESTAHDAILNVVRQTKPANLESVELFDIFRGKNIPEGQKSVAYAFTYRNPERTLTDAEVNAAHEKLVQQFRQSLKATIRE
ncbi:MAG: phenylalanine--tRNA ligase subunit beta, partial [Verrucomicrobiota bacterium]